MERRLSAIREDSQRQLQYDLSADGAIDESEWAVIERIVRTEVHTERVLRTGEYSRTFEPETIEARFRLIGLLGRGGQGLTYLAQDLKTGDHVVVKELLLSEVEDWKAVELFDRESQILRELSHPRIPGYIDAFHVESDSRTRFFLVQDYVEGESLEDFLERGERFGEARVRQFLNSMGDVLDYIHSQNPPVIHRDIKPSNIMVGVDDNYYLIDFGAVQAVVPETIGGSTVVGTSGFVPFEQFRGKAVPQSDIFALAATVVNLMTGVHPSLFEHEGPKIVLPKDFGASDELRQWVEHALLPDATERPESVDLSAKKQKSTGLVPVEPPRTPNVSIYRDSNNRRVVQMKSDGLVLIELMYWGADCIARVAHRNPRGQWGPTAFALAAGICGLALLISGMMGGKGTLLLVGLGLVLVAAFVAKLTLGVAYRTLTLSPGHLEVGSQVYEWGQVRKFVVVHGDGDHHDARVHLKLADEDIQIGATLPSAHARKLTRALNKKVTVLKRKR